MPRKDPIAHMRNAQVQASDKPYEPYRLSTDPLPFLQIRKMFPEPAVCPRYSALQKVNFEWRMGITLSMVFPGVMHVVMRGENMQELATAIMQNRVEFIQEYDKMEWPNFEIVKSKPFIKSIRIQTPYDDDEDPPMNKRH